MGKIRVKTFGDEEQEEAEKQKKAIKKAEKKSREEFSGQTSEKAEDSAEQNTKEPTIEVKQESEKPAFQDLQSKGETLEPQTEQTETENTIEEAKAHSAKAPRAKKAKFVKKKIRSTAYKNKLMEIEKNKTYSLSEGIELLRKVKIAKFDETVELHINTTEAGISGNVKLPHGTGKEIRIAIASDELIEQIEKGLPANADAKASGRRGKVNFDVLIATPDMMPKLARVARVLGPRGLMPNPKNGTISSDPQEAMKKFQGGQISFKTESKLPLIHLSVGKTSFEDKQLTENIKTIITAIKRDRIRKVTLKSTMSPGIRIQV